MRAKLFETEEPLLRRRLRKPRESLARGTHKHLLRVGREHKKAVTRDSIKAAAKQLFSELDYEKATVRAIAARAGVALGTVLRHAEDKRDLILLAYNDDVEAAIARAAGVISENVSFDQNLLAFFLVFYESYAANLQLARTYLQINFFCIWDECQRTRPKPAPQARSCQKDCAAGTEAPRTQAGCQTRDGGDAVPLSP